MTKRAVLVLTAVGIAGCGGSPVTPAPPANVSPIVAAGSYTLLLNAAGSDCFTSTRAGTAAPDPRMRAAVTLIAVGTGWRVQGPVGPAPIQIDLLQNGSSVSGRAFGVLLDGATRVSLDHPLSGSANGITNSVMGTVQGPVSYTVDGGSTICSENLWSLTPAS